MPHDKDKPFPADPEIVTFRYRGPDRRNHDPEAETVESTSGDVTFDAKGNPVWQIRVDVLRRRKDDDTMDLLKRLEVDSLSLADEHDATEDTGYNPYDPTYKDGKTK